VAVNSFVLGPYLTTPVLVARQTCPTKLAVSGFCT